MRLQRAAAIAIAGLALMALGAPAAQAQRSEFFGVVQGPPLDDTDFQTIATTKVKTVRFLVPWFLIERTQGQLDWSDTDETVGGLAARGIRGAPIVFGSPGWTHRGSAYRPPVPSPSAQQAWQEFLKAAVERYGPGGSYWGTPYHEQFGASAVPLPMTSWQIWNEPNIKPQFYPGATVAQAAGRYGKLVRISHDAIKSVDPKAQIVLAGLATQNDSDAFDFLNALYGVRNIKAYFSVVAQHPYAASVETVRAAIQHVRQVMANHGDQATPLWITEFGWGSAPPDGSGINVGPAEQARRLTRAFNMILSNRSAWNLQRLFWFHWRDPAPGSPFHDICIRCGSAGLLNYDRSPKPAFNAFTAFTADATPPKAKINWGPVQGSTIADPTPTLKFVSNEAGSTFLCRMDAGPLKACASPYTTARLSNGTHTFSVRAIDAAGNESAIVSRSFTVNAGA